MREWLDNLQPRERRILLAGSILAAIIVIWAGIWSPLSGATANLRVAVSEKQRLEVALQRAAVLPGRESGTRIAPGNAGTSLLVLVERTHQAHGLGGAFTQTRPDGSEAIEINFQNASFEAMLSWLVLLQTEHGVRIDSATFNSTREPGRVGGRLLLRRA